MVPCWPTPSLSLIHILITSDFDFQGALTRLGSSLAGSDTVLGDVGAFCIEVFGGTHPQETDGAAVPNPASILNSELQFLSLGPDRLTLREHYTGASRLGIDLEQAEEAPPPVEEPAPQEETPLPVPAVGTVITVSDYSGQALPENYTMDRLSLGELETVTPVLGHLNSVYGYRDHPIDGRYQFHGGVDIGGQMGAPIAAFAAGTVEYTGQDDSYGLYFQINHGNGVKSFYAHCSKINVVKGQTVAAGEKVAEVGASGSATGPHLHLELKYEKMHINPAYYVEFLEDG